MIGGERLQGWGAVGGGGGSCLHVLVYAVVEQQRVRHADAVRLHGVAGAVIKISNLVVIKVTNPVLAGGRHAALAALLTIWNNTRQKSALTACFAALSICLLHVIGCGCGAE